MIPCKKDKCLKFAICKWKVTIFCTPLYEYHNINTQKDVMRNLHKVIDIYLEVFKDMPPRFTAPIVIAERLPVWTKGRFI